MAGTKLLEASARLNHLWFRSRGEVSKRDPTRVIAAVKQAVRWCRLVQLVTRSGGAFPTGCLFCVARIARNLCRVAIRA
jgi:hypothetical protein